MAGPSSLASRHRALMGLLAVHAVVFWAVVGGGAAWATASVECSAGTMAEIALGRLRWPLFGGFDGLLGGSFIAAMAGLPLFAVLGVTGLSTKFVAWLYSGAVLVVIYGLVDRHGWGTPRARRGAALAASAGVAFGPPALVFPQLVFGNWHWSQLLFDYGVAWAALELWSRERTGERAGPARWIGLGLLTGAGLFNSMGSAPFLAIAWVGLAVGLVRPLGTRIVGRLAGASVGLAFGLTPLAFKALSAPFGSSAPDQTLGRLRRVALHPERLLELVGDELVWSLRFQDLLPEIGGRALLLGALWAVVCWVGWGLATVLAVRRRAPVPGLATLFVLAFGAACVVFFTGLEVLPLAFSNLRETGVRQLPPLLAALVVGSACGWAGLGGRLRAGSPVALLSWCASALPAAIGLATLIGSLGQAPRPGDVSSYRGSCLDANAFFASKHFVDRPLDLQALCAAQPAPEARRACAAGASWGLGYAALEFGAPDDLPTGWGAMRPGLHPRAGRACGIFDGALRERCLLGLGWHLGQLDWGRPGWPLTSCSTLDPDDVEGCWRGVGFGVGDHLAGTPDRIGQLVLRAPARWRPSVARGAGYSIGRTWNDEIVPLALCSAAGPEAGAGCARGVADAMAER